MKHCSYRILGMLLGASFLAACSSSGNDSADNQLGDEVSSRTLSQNAPLSGAIQTKRDVDWYEIEAKQGDIVSVRVSNDTLRADVDLLLTVYQKDFNGNLTRLFADHATENSSFTSEVTANVFVDQDKTLYASVRDLNDDEASSKEIYNISFDIAKPEDGNSTFDEATVVQTDGSCQTDSIGNVGDVDVYKFSVHESRVIQLATTFKAFSSGSSVSLAMSLYDDQGNLIRTASQSSNDNYHLIEALAAGDYFVLLKDQGQDDFDSASSFSTCITQLDRVEVAENDDKSTAQPVNDVNGFSLNGSLDYANDEDWNSISIDPLQPGQVRVLSVDFDPSLSRGCDSWFLVEIFDTNDDVIFSKEYSSEQIPSTLHVKTDVAGKHFVRIAPVDKKICLLDGVAGAQYALTIAETDIEDLAEITLDGNDSESTADVLDPTSNQSLTGKIGYLGDVDWYSISVPNSDKHRVLEVFLDSDQPTPLEYFMLIKKDGATVADFISSGKDANPVEFKTSFLIPAQTGETNREYQIKLSDLRADEGDLHTNYTIRANLVEIEEADPAIPANNHALSAATYLSEDIEQDAISVAADNLLSVSVFGKNHIGAYDNKAMVENIASHTTVNAQNNTLKVEFPWLSGYIDFDGDRDWARLDLSQIYADAGGTEDNWYADIDVELYSAGSIVEYAWALYRDHNNNGSLREGRSSKSGYFALVGDKSASTNEYYRLTPSESESLWVNKEFVGGVPFYLSLSDVRASESGSHAKNDWGYDNAYFVRVKLVFHPGKERPEPQE